MSERNQKRNSPETLEEHERFILTEPDSIEIASGYSISVKYDKEGRPIIYVKRYGDVDTKGLRREIERNYPGAAIQGLEKPRIIKVEKAPREKSKKPRVKTSQKK